MHLWCMKRPTQVFNFRIQNSNSGSVDVYIDGEIVDASTQEIYKYWFGDDTSVSFKSFREELEKSGANTYNIYINSPGGQVTDAMAIHDYLISERNKGKKVNTIGRGIVASAATYVLMAGDSPELSAISWFMIHNVSGFAWGDVNEVERQANLLRKFNDSVRDFYANSTGLSSKVITEMMNAETWMQGQEAKDKGFVKRVSDEVTFSNLISQDHWDYADKSVLAAYNSAVKPPVTPPENSPSAIQQFILNQNADMKKFFQNILDGLKNLKTEDTAKPADIVNQITEAITKPFEDLGTEIENQISTAVNTSKTELQNAVKKDYDEKISNLETKVSNLETENTELKKEIADDKGKRTNSGKSDTVQAIGSFS
jgi:ATP-dependent Clp protease, protease subunit